MPKLKKGKDDQFKMNNYIIDSKIYIAYIILRSLI